MLDGINGECKGLFSGSKSKMSNEAKRFTELKDCLEGKDG